MSVGSNFRFSQRQKDKHMHLGNTIQNSCGNISTICQKNLKEHFLKFRLHESKNCSVIFFISSKVIFFQLTVKQNLMLIYLLPAHSHVQYTKLQCCIKNFSAAKYTENKLRYLLVMWIPFTMTISVGF